MKENPVACSLWDRVQAGLIFFRHRGWWYWFWEKHRADLATYEAPDASHRA